MISLPVHAMPPGLSSVPDWTPLIEGSGLNFSRIQPNVTRGVVVVLPQSATDGSEGELGTANPRQEALSAGSVLEFFGDGVGRSLANPGGCSEGDGGEREVCARIA
jgi:hypothetical protein